MTEIGKINRLTVQRIRDYGAHLDGGELGNILLPIKYVPKKCRPGDELEVFVYGGGQDRLRATTQRPKAMVGQFATLRVVANATAGAFLDWGLPKDLLVPKKEQLTRMDAGKEYVVFIFLDPKSNRITASTKLDKFLSKEPPSYTEGEAVDLYIYDQTEVGYKALINNSHGGVIYRNEVFNPIKLGQQRKGYIKKVRPDLKIDLTLQQPGYKKIEAISQTILQTIKKHGGRIAITDQSPAQEIYTMFGVSKKAFKMAVGALYKKRLITMGPKGIKLAR